MLLTVHRGYHPTVQGGNGIAEYVPLWMSAGRFLNVTTVRFVPTLSEGLAYCL